MGFIHDTKSEVLGFEERHESVYLTEGVKGHIFCYGDGSVEISKEFLQLLVEFIKKNTECLEVEQK